MSSIVKNEKKKYYRFNILRRAEGKKFNFRKPTGRASGTVPLCFDLPFCKCVSYLLYQTFVLNLQTFIVTLTNLYSFVTKFVKVNKKSKLIEYKILIKLVGLIQPSLNCLIHLYKRWIVMFKLKEDFWIS